MVPALAPKTTLIPSDLNTLLSNPRTPWSVSPQLFARITSQTFDQPFKRCEVLNSDPEFNFLLKYFEHQKPAGYAIKRIMCIHNPNHTQMFEIALKNIEQEATNPFFAPQGKEEDPKQDRLRVIQRWEKLTSQFSPLEIKSPNSRTDSCVHAKVLPLWHGSSPEVCESICSTGFTVSGKHHYFHESASKGSAFSTDKGYFGSGIYFTNSAQYAAMYSSGGYLLLTWVSMREPYPVVNDVPHPQKGSDMLKLEAKEHYQRYNTHYIPVALAKPGTMEYYPCYKDQPPAWDEVVVFHNSQTLPRFWIELGVDFPNVVISELSNAGELLTILFNLLDKKEIQSHAVLSGALQVKADEMLELPETTPLKPEDQKLLKLVKRLMPEGQSISPSVMNALLKSASINPAIIVSPLKENPSIQKPPALSVSSLIPALPSAPLKPTLPAMAFGAAEWKKYFGDVGVEPPLPADIDKILDAPCPFWLNKNVSDTHVLVLIPQTVNGKSLNLKLLEKLVQKPLQGNATQYIGFYIGEYTDPLAPKSHWVLMTRDVIEGSRSKNYSDQQALIARYSQKTKILYEVPTVLDAAVCIFMEYVRTGARLYPDNPLTFTRCQEKYNADWQLAVGGFSAAGLRVYDYDFASEIGGVGSLRKF